MKVLGIGESVIDNLIITHQSNKGKIGVPQKHVGGPIPSALVLLARLGVDCTLMTSLGRDKEATLIKTVMEKENIRLVLTLQKKTKIHSVLVNEATGQREKQRGKVIHEPITNLSRRFLEQFDIIMLDRHEKEAFFEVLRKKKPSTVLVVDSSTEVSDFTLKMLKHAQYPILPIEALAKIKKGEPLIHCLSALHQMLLKPMIITIGELGSILFDSRKLELVPSLAIKAIDTTGAGDIYRGAFAYGLIQKWKINECLQFANLVAGLQCTKIGNIAAIPTRQEIDLCKKLVIQKRNVTTQTVDNYFSELFTKTL